MSHQHLISEERFAIELFLRLGMSIREIAVSLRRNHTTISRELLTKRLCQRVSR